MRHLRHTLLFWQHRKDRNKPRENAGFQAFSVPVTRTSILSKPLYLYVNLCYNNTVVEQFDSAPANRQGVIY